jgi:hypothetical protein
MAPTGIAAGAWGDSPAMVAGLQNRMAHGDHQLTYEEPMTSIPPMYFFQGDFISPLTKANNFISAFGRHTTRKIKRKTVTHKRRSTKKKTKKTQKAKKGIKTKKGIKKAIKFYKKYKKSRSKLSFKRWCKKNKVKYVKVQTLKRYMKRRN